MTERSITFSGEMVREILEGHKTQTRRPIKTQPDKQWNINADGSYCPNDHEKGEKCNYSQSLKCPFGKVGDRLWVKEKYVLSSANQPVYEADCRDKRGDLWASIKSDPSDVDWFPARAMSKCFSRITIEITNIRVQRVQEIAHEDAIAEGMKSYEAEFPLQNKTMPLSCHAFANLWNSLYNEKGFGWEVNPFVWVLSFRRIA